MGKGAQRGVVQVWNRRDRRATSRTEVLSSFLNFFSFFQIMERKGLKRSRSEVKGWSQPSQRSTKRRRSYKRSTKKSVVDFGASFPPGRVRTKLRYGLVVVNNDTAIDDNVIRLNSVFDPEFTQTGHQPMGRDQMVTLYSKYLVTRVDVKWVIQCGLSVTSPFVVVLVPNNDATVFTSTTTAMESKDAIVKSVNLGQTAEFTTSYFPNRIAGQSMRKYRDDDLNSALVGTNPSEEIVLHIVMATGGGAGAADGSISVNAVFTYHTEWFDSLQLGLS